MAVSIIIPVYNEEKTVAALLNEIQGVALSQQVIVINDGSTDGTAAILDLLQHAHGFTLLEHKRNRGKGAALKTAIPYITGEVSIIQDADLETKPENYPRLIQPILEGEAEVVFTHRLRHPQAKGSLAYQVYRFGSAVHTLLVNLLFSAQVKDLNSGCKAFRSDVLRGLALQSNGFAVEHEITAKVLKRRYRLRQLPIQYFPRSTRDGKKIRPWDGIKGIAALFYYRFSR